MSKSHLYSIVWALCTLMILSCSSNDHTLHSLKIKEDKISLEPVVSNPITIGIETNAPDWDYSTNATWLNAEKSGSFIVLMPSSNLSPEDREASIIVTAGNAEAVRIDITQKFKMYANYVNGLYSIRAASYGPTNGSPWESNIIPYYDDHAVMNFNNEPDNFILLHFMLNTHTIRNNVLIDVFQDGEDEYWLTQEIGYIEDASYLYLYEEPYWDGVWSSDRTTLTFEKNLTLTSGPYTFSFPVVVYHGVYCNEQWQGVYGNPYAFLKFTRKEATKSELKDIYPARLNAQRNVRNLTERELKIVSEKKEFKKFTFDK